MLCHICCVPMFLPDTLAGRSDEEASALRTASLSLDFTLSSLLIMLREGKSSVPDFCEVLSWFFDIVTMEQPASLLPPALRADQQQQQHPKLDWVRQAKVLAFLEFITDASAITVNEIVFPSLAALSWYSERSAVLGEFIGSQKPLLLLLRCVCFCGSRAMREFAARVIRCALADNNPSEWKMQKKQTEQSQRLFEAPLAFSSSSSSFSPGQPQKFVFVPNSYFVHSYSKMSLNGSPLLGEVHGQNLHQGNNTQKQGNKAPEDNTDISTFLFGKPLKVFQTNVQKKGGGGGGDVGDAVEREEDIMELEELPIHFPLMFFNYSWMQIIYDYPQNPNYINRFDKSAATIPLFGFNKFDSLQADRPFFSAFIPPCALNPSFSGDPDVTFLNEPAQNKAPAAAAVAIGEASESKLAGAKAAQPNIVKEEARKELLAALLHFVETQFEGKLNEMIIKAMEAATLQAQSQQNSINSNTNTAPDVPLPFSPELYSLDAFFALFCWLLSTRTLITQAGASISAPLQIAKRTMLSTTLLEVLPAAVLSEGFLKTVLLLLSTLSHEHLSSHLDMNRLAVLRFLALAVSVGGVDRILWKFHSSAEVSIARLVLPSAGTASAQMQLYTDEYFYAYFSFILLLCESDRQRYIYLFGSFVSFADCRAILSAPQKYPRSAPLLALLVLQFVCYAPQYRVFVLDILFDDAGRLRLASSDTLKMMHHLYFPMPILPADPSWLKSTPRMHWKTNDSQHLFDSQPVLAKFLPFPHTAFLSPLPARFNSQASSVLHNVMVAPSSSLSSSSSPSSSSSSSSSSSFVMNSSPMGGESSSQLSEQGKAFAADEEAITQSKMISYGFISSQFLKKPLEVVGNRQVSLVQACCALFNSKSNTENALSLINLAPFWSGKRFIRAVDSQQHPLMQALDVLDVLITDWFEGSIAGTFMDMSAVLAVEYRSLFAGFAPLSGDRLAQKTFSEQGLPQQLKGELWTNRVPAAPPSSDFKSAEEMALVKEFLTTALFLLSSFTCCCFPLCVRVRSLRLVVMLLPTVSSCVPRLSEKLLDVLLVAFNAIYTKEPVRAIHATKYRPSKPKNECAVDETNPFFTHCLVNNISQDFPPGCDECIPFSYFYSSQSAALAAPSQSSADFMVANATNAADAADVPHAPLVNSLLVQLLWRWQLFLTLCVAHLCKQEVEAAQGKAAEAEDITISQQLDQICPGNLKPKEKTVNRARWMLVKVMRLTEVTLFAFVHTHPLPHSKDVVLPWPSIFEEKTEFVHFGLDISQAVQRALMMNFSLYFTVYCTSGKETYEPSTTLFEPMLYHLFMRRPLFISAALSLGDPRIISSFREHFRRALSRQQSVLCITLIRALKERVNEIVELVSSQETSAFLASNECSLPPLLVACVQSLDLFSLQYRSVTDTLAPYVEQLVKITEYLNAFRARSMIVGDVVQRLELIIAAVKQTSAQSPFSASKSSGQSREDVPVIAPTLNTSLFLPRSPKVIGPSYSFSNSSLTETDASKKMSS